MCHKSGEVSPRALGTDLCSAFDSLVESCRQQIKGSQSLSCGVFLLLASGREGALDGDTTEARTLVTGETGS